jgi:type IV pilus assembly protein PilY1
MLGTQASVLVGTGDREKPLASGSAALVKNRFYGIRDDVKKTGDPVGTTPTVVNGAGTDAALATANQLTNVTSVTTELNPTSLAAHGWYRDLFTTSTPYEQVVTTPLTIGGQTYFSTFQPRSSTSTGSNKCSNLGNARAYKLDFQTGVIAPNSVGAYAPDDFKSQGIPPSPVGGLVSIDGKTVPFCIGCSGPTVLSPNKLVPKVKPDRKPVYRSQKIDS